MATRKDLTADDVELHVDDELHRNIPKHTDAEAKTFNESVARAGRYHESIKYWTEKGKALILNGRHRWWHWCDQPEDTPLPPPAAEEIFLPDRRAARLWVLENELGCKHLTKDQQKTLIGEYYNEQKQARGGDRKSTDQNDTLIAEDPETQGDTAQQIAEEHGVSAPTVKRYGKFVEAKNEIASKCAILHNELENGTLKASDAAIKQMAELSATDLGKVRRNLKDKLDWNHGFTTAAAPNGQPNGKAGSGKGAKESPAASKPTKSDPFKTQKSKTIKTAEALMRAFEDLNELRKSRECASAVKTCKALIEKAKNW